MKILIFGSKGWIGSMFIDILKTLNNSSIDFKEALCRADNVDDVKLEIFEYNPTHVVSFIGRTHGPNYSTIDYLEQEGKLVENVNDNLFAPFVLAQLSNIYNYHYTYLGTGCIFTTKDLNEEINGFDEDDLPNFFGSSYSVVKGFTDRMMHLYSNVLNLRIRMPITNNYNSRNFITKITNYKKICSIPNSMSVLTEILPYVLDMMKKSITGTINLVNPGLISHNEILEMYKELVDKDFKWENFSIEEQRQILKADRSNNYLDTSKLTNMYPNIINIKDSVRKCLLNYNNYTKNNE
jgi:dTDP-4-dehydrorhamnose reductase